MNLRGRSTRKALKALIPPVSNFITLSVLKQGHALITCKARVEDKLIMNSIEVIQHITYTNVLPLTIHLHLINIAMVH